VIAEADHRRIVVILLAATRTLRVARKILGLA
jgi:hypothetical protein